MVEAVATGTQQIVTEGAANFGQWAPRSRPASSLSVEQPEHL